MNEGILPQAPAETSKRRKGALCRARNQACAAILCAKCCKVWLGLDLTEIESRWQRLSDAQRLLVAQGQLLLFEQGGQARSLPCIFGISRKVAHFARIGLQIEKLGLVDLRIDNQLPAIVAHGALHVAIGGEDCCPPRFLFACEYGGQA